MRYAVDGHIDNGVIFWNEPDARGWAAAGAEVEAPNASNASEIEKNTTHARLEQLLSTLRKPDRLQINWTITSDYGDVLANYDRKTQENPVSKFTKYERDGRYKRYFTRMNCRQLRREKLRIFYGTKITANPPMTAVTESSLKNHYTSLSKNLNNFFTTKINNMRTILGSNFTVKQLDTKGTIKVLDEFFNPSHAAITEYDPTKNYDYEKSIQTNLLPGEITEWTTGGKGDKPDFGIWRDGHYEQVITAKLWCKNTSPGMLEQLTNMPFLDYAITLNMEPIDVQEEIKRQERLLKLVKSGKTEAQRTEIEIKKARIRALSQGFTFPMNCLFSIRVWHKDKAELTVRVNQLKMVIGMMQGMQTWELANPVSTRNLVLSTAPGWMYSDYKGHALYSENTYLCDLLPVSATFTGSLKNAMALYDGNNYNLVGISPILSGTPQHCAILGSTGSGKSFLVNDLLTQTDPYFDYTVIIEEGLSYGNYTQLHGCTPIIVHLDSEMTINYFDTCGSPLTSSHLKSVTALAASLCGDYSHDETPTARRAIMSKYIEMIYDDAYEQFIRDNESLKPEIARMAIASAKMRETMPDSTSMIEAYITLRDELKDKTAKAEGIYSSVTEMEITTFMGDNLKQMRNMAFAFMKPTNMPVHSMLSEMITHAHGQQIESRAAYVERLGDMLRTWNRGGTNGNLIDGHTTIDLTGRVTHFELGMIPDSAADLKIVVARMIDQLCRTRIISMPRNTFKRYIFEEMGRFMMIPGGEDIIAEGYGQMRKFNCWNVSVTQQYSKFRDTAVGKAIIGNSAMFLLLRQTDKTDVDTLAEAIGLSEMTKYMIMTHPKPEQIDEGEDIYSRFTYFHLGEKQPIVGTVRNYVDNPMLIAANTKGEEVAKRNKMLQVAKDKGIDMFDAIIMDKAI